MDEQQEAYIAEYEAFMGKLSTQEVSPGEVGILIARLSSYFSTYNLRLAKATRNLAIVASEMEKTKDDMGKTIASTKAKALTEASPEANVYETNKAHVQNIESHINSLKSLLKSLTNEFSYQQ